MRKLLRVQEHEEISVPLSDMLTQDRVDLYDDVQRKDYLQARLSGDRVVFTAGSHVGLIPLNDRIELEVVPKVRVQQLTHIVRVARRAPEVLESFRRWYHPYRDDLASVLDLVCAAFISATDEVLRRGLHREYERRVQDTSYPRGRILTGRTIQLRAQRKKHIVSASWHEPSVDTAPNRLLKYALWRVARLLGATPRLKGRASMLRELQRLFLALEGVALDERGTLPLHSTSVELASLSSRWRYYASALSIALLIVEGQGVELDRSGERVELPSMLVNMSDVFEAYVRETLRSGLRRHGLEAADGNWEPPPGAKKALFEDAKEPTITPDIVIRAAPRAARAVVEVKYKTFKGGPLREELSQAITYALSYGAPAAVVVHAAAGGRSSLERRGRVGGVTVYQYSMNLNGRLEEEEAALAKAVLGICEAATSPPR